MNGNQLITKHSAKFDTVEKSKRPGVLATLRGPVTGWKPNRNGRTYSSCRIPRLFLALP